MEKASLNEINQQAESVLLRLYRIWRQGNIMPHAQKRLLIEALKEYDEGFAKIAGSYGRSTQSERRASYYSLFTRS